MYDNSTQPSAVLPLVAAAVGAGLAGLVVRRIHASRGKIRARDGRPRRGVAGDSRHGGPAPGRRRSRAGGPRP